MIIESFSCACRLLITESYNLSGYFSKVQISMVVVKVLQFNRLIFFFSRKRLGHEFAPSIKFSSEGRACLPLTPDKNTNECKKNSYVCAFFYKFKIVGECQSNRKSVHKKRTIKWQIFCYPTIQQKIFSPFFVSSTVHYTK